MFAMPQTAAGPLDKRADVLSAQPDAFLVTIPDAERLSLQSRFVTNQFEAEILSGLEARIRTAQLLDPSAVPRDLVTMNSRVVVRDVDTGERMVLRLVFPSCATARKSRVSVLTPLGAALLGARAGQTLTYRVAGALSTLVLEAIRYQPEAAGDYYG
jgi:regulator of nucleoside diphosphate kinase